MLTRTTVLEHIQQLPEKFSFAELKEKLRVSENSLVQPNLSPMNANPPQLTPRESAVLRLMAKGLSYQEVAQSLNIAQGTLKSHLHNIFRKLRVNNRAAAIRCYTHHPISNVPKQDPESGAADWNRLTTEQFLAGYAESDAIYDTL